MKKKTIKVWTSFHYSSLHIKMMKKGHVINNRTPFNTVIPGKPSIKWKNLRTKYHHSISSWFTKMLRHLMIFDTPFNVKFVTILSEKLKSKIPSQHQQLVH